MTVTATVIKAATPKVLKSCVRSTRYVVISVNIASGCLDTFETGCLEQAKSYFSLRGDPATWRGLQIIQFDVNGGAK